MWAMNFQMFKLDLEKAEEPVINCQHPLDRRKSKQVPWKHLLLPYWLCQAFDCVDHKKLWQILKEMGIPENVTYLLRNQYASQEATVRTRHEQQTGSKTGKEYIKAVYCHPADLTYMQSSSSKMSGWMKHKQESRLQGEVAITSDIQMTSLLQQKA